MTALLNAQDQEGDQEKKDDYFRCQIPIESSKATISAGRRKTCVQVQEASIDGFTVLVRDKDAKNLRMGKPWVIEFDGSRLEVIGQWFFNAPGGFIQVGLRRMRDLTPEPVFRTPFFSRFSTAKMSGSATSAAGFGGFVIVLFLGLSMPGLGEQLGTSDRIQGAVKWICSEFTGLF
jgi:hypothetical protein